MPVPVPVVLTILDGWGIAEPSPTNAVSVAATPNMDRLSGAYPMTTLTAHNGLVGLPEGQMGNSEVGHLNIGAGRIVYQDFTRIDLAARRGEFATNPVLAGVMDAVTATGGRLHLCGLLSDGGVHSHIRHLIALLEVAAARGLGERVFVHAFMDGRDTPPSSGISYMEELARAMARTGCGRAPGGRVASGTVRRSGRRNQNTDPRPASLLTPISPCISSTSCRQMDKPSPVPPYWRVMEESPCEKASNRRARCCSSMPIPVSSTSKCTTVAAASS